jgi:hypothetical protein
MRRVAEQLDRWRRWSGDGRTLHPAFRIVGLALLAALIVWLFLRQLELAGDWRIDDAYITFSFAKNLGRGEGPVYSHGVRVEGYSNFLWMVLLSAGYAVREKLGAYATARVMSYISLSLMSAAMWKLSRRHAGPVASAVVLVVLACCTDLARAAQSGLETAAYAAALTIATFGYLRESPERRRWSLFGFLVVALMRIDGFVPLLFVVGFEIVDGLIGKRLRWKTLLQWIGPVAILYGTWFAWRWAYYGLPLPTTYYAKTLVDLGDKYRATTYAWDFVRALGLQALLPFALIAVARKPSRDTLFVALLTLCHGAYVLQTGGDWMPLWRFWLPILGLLLVMASWGMSESWRACSGLRWWARWVPLAVMGAACWFTARSADASTIDTPQEDLVVKHAAVVRAHTVDNLLNHTRFINAILRQPGEKLATDYGGVFALYTDAAVIEEWGLCNKDIALHGDATGITPIYGKSCAKCIADAEPDYLHTMVPFMRSRDAFANIQSVVAQIFHGVAMDSFLHFARAYAVGRAYQTRSQTAVWFLERRRPGMPLVPRTPADGIRIDYPFEPGGTE